MSNNKTNGGIGLGSLLFLVFLVMKLAGIGIVANWSWWAVTSPLWVQISMVVGLALLTTIIKVIKGRV